MGCSCLRLTRCDLYLLSFDTTFSSLSTSCFSRCLPSFVNILDTRPMPIGCLTRRLTRVKESVISSQFVSLPLLLPPHASNCSPEMHESSHLHAFQSSCSLLARWTRRYRVRTQRPTSWRIDLTLQKGKEPTIRLDHIACFLFCYSPSISFALFMVHT